MDSYKAYIIAQTAPSLPASVPIIKNVSAGPTSGDVCITKGYTLLFKHLQRLALVVANGL